MGPKKAGGGVHPRRTSRATRGTVGDDTSQKKPERGSDVVLIHGVTEDGKGFHVLRARGERLELGQVRPLEHGKPVHGDIVKLHPRPGRPYLCDVETEYSAQTAPQYRQQRAEVPQRRKGPVQVASAAYRRNWEAIWSGSRRKSDELLN